MLLAPALCCNKQNWLLNLNLIYKTLQTGAGHKIAIDVKTNGSIYQKKLSYKMLGLTVSSKLDLGSYINSTAKTTSKKIEALICSVKFLSSEVASYHYKFTIQSCMMYCYHVQVGNPICFMELLDKLQKQMIVRLHVHASGHA